MTGSNYMLESGDTKILIDCGLQQGGHFAERHNFDPFPYRPEEIKAVFITHAHVDHTGKLPKLMKDGFRGTIYSTPPTHDFSELLLLDSEHILAKDAEHFKMPPLYTTTDIKNTMALWKTMHYHEPFLVGPFTVEFFDAGHILGSACIRISAEGKSVVFSGDLGNYPAPIIHVTDPLPASDFVLIESTYGDRVHENEDTRMEALEDAIEDTVKSGGTLMIPAFAMERTQELLFHLHTLFEEGRIPRVPVYIDSPLAIKVTTVYKKYENYFNDTSYKMVRSGDDILNFKGLHLTLTTEQSKEINHVPSPKIIIAGSGMSNGGRILHHEARYLPDPRSMILFVGYQAGGSLGRQILEGAKVVKIFGEEVPVHCKSRVLSGYSAHADQPRLMEWVLPRRTTLKKVFVVQGEGESSKVLAQKMRDELAIDTAVPAAGESVML